jgi:hypothetical protein
MNRIEKLEAALVLIQEVRATLCNDRSKCECCGCTTYSDKHEWKLDQALEAAAHRVRKTKEELTRLEDVKKI